VIYIIVFNFIQKYRNISTRKFESGYSKTSKKEKSWTFGQITKQDFR